VALVAVNRLNCRAAPSAASAVVDIAQKGETLVVETIDGSWRRVRLRGASCWVSADYLQPGA
jgi:uncharacterized protein YraI